MVGQNLFPSGREDCEDGPVPSRPHAALGGWENDTRTQPPFQWVRRDESGHFLASDLMPWLSCYRISSMPNQGAHVVLEGGPLCGPGDVTHVDLQASVVQVAAVKGRLLLNGHPKVGQLEWKGATQ